MEVKNQTNCFQLINFFVEFSKRDPPVLVRTHLMVFQFQFQLFNFFFFTIFIKFEKDMFYYDDKVFGNQTFVSFVKKDIYELPSTRPEYKLALESDNEAVTQWMDSISRVLQFFQFNLYSIIIYLNL